MVKKLYVGNLNFKTTEEEIRSLFGQYGEVQSVNMITDRDTGRPRGFCFVEMENADQAMTELNGKEFAGRNLTVNEAKQREDRGPRQGGGGGRGGYGGGSGGYGGGGRGGYGNGGGYNR